MRISSHKKRGMAIITTLMILSLLLALISAFLIVNRAGNRFTVNSLEKRQAQDAALTALNYAVHHLENDRNWGTQSVSPDQFPPLGPVVRFHHTFNAATHTLTGDGIYSVDGDLTKPTGTIKLIVRNNLQRREPLDGVVPPNAISVEAEVAVGSVTRRLDTLLRPEVLSHGSVSAGDNMLLDGVAGLIRIESRDPYVNQIRAGENLYLPSASDVKFLKHGVAASSSVLRVGGTDLASASDTAVMNAGETSGGTYLPNASTPQVQTFDPNDFDLPTETAPLAAGHWVFGDVTKVEWIPHTVTYSTGDFFDPTDDVIRYQKKESVYNSLTAPNGTVYPAGAANLGSTVLDPPGDPSGVYASPGGYGVASPGATGFVGAPSVQAEQDVHELASGVKVNVVTAQLASLHGKMITVNGDLIVSGTGTRQPELYFGYDISAGGVASQTALVDGVEAAKEEPSKYMSAIKASGDINIVGGYIGYGSLVAGGDVTVKASSGLSAAPGLGVLVKGNNIIINAATEPEPALPGASVDVDYPIFRDAINADSGGNWTNYNSWLSHTKPTRENMIGSLRGRSSGVNASTAWSSFESQIGGGGPYPGGLITSNGWGSGNLSVDQYVRLKTYYQTVSFGYNNGNGDPTWLSLGQRVDDTEGRIENTLNSIAQWGDSYKMTMQAFLANPDPGLPDMFTEGMIFADNNITINADNKSVKLVGSVVANQGSLQINDATRLDLVYDRELVDDLHLGGKNGPIKLERVFFTLE